jgi:hypothetical protein
VRRRELLKGIAVAGAGVLSDPDAVFSSLNLRAETLNKDTTEPRPPDLDELAGEWIAGSIIEGLPAVSNFHGSVQSSRNIVGIESFTVPPLAQGSELASLTLDGENLLAQDFRWYPYQVLRRTRSADLEIVATVRMPFESSGILFSVEATNLGKRVRTATLAVNLHSAIRHYPEKWTWDTPRPRKEDLSGFSTREVRAESGRIFLNQDSRSNAVVAFAFLHEPENISDDKRSVGWSPPIGQGEAFRLEFVMAAGTDLDSTLKRVSTWKEKFRETWEAAGDLWRQRFQEAFTPGNRHFSGNLPTLVTDDAKVRRMYYASVLSLLCLERTNFGPRFPRVFVTASPRWANTLVYFWDTSFFATVWALLDPLAMRDQLKLFLDSDIHSCYAVDFHTLQTVGPWYSANDYSVFRLVTTYVYVTRDWHFLDEPLRNGHSVIDTLQDLSLHWRTLTRGTGLLANYGDASNLLETVPTYVEYVPAMNAANVWMLRAMAKLRNKRGEVARSVELRNEADALAVEVLDLYVDHEGFWACKLSDGKRVEVRHCIDFFTLIGCMQGDLGQHRIGEMVGFVNRELWTAGWLRALSLRDGAASKATRADHGSTGSYDAWPALTAEAMFRVGLEQEALARLRSLEPANHEGPFGQSHYCATQEYPVRKAVSFGQDYFASASGAFAEITLRTICGFTPDVDDQWQWSPPRVPGLSGRLINLRYKGKLLSASIDSP